MADHGECTILVPASDSPGRVAGHRIGAVLQYGTVVFVPLCIC